MSNILYNRVHNMYAPGKYRQRPQRNEKEAPSVNHPGDCCRQSLFRVFRCRGPPVNGVFRGFRWSGESYHGGEFIRNRAHAMIGFQYTPITITYSD